MEETYRYWT